MIVRKPTQIYCCVVSHERLIFELWSNVLTTNYNCSSSIFTAAAYKRSLLLTNTTKRVALDLGNSGTETHYRTLLVGGSPRFWRFSLTANWCYGGERYVRGSVTSETSLGGGVCVHAFQLLIIPLLYCAIEKTAGALVVVMVVHPFKLWSKINISATTAAHVRWGWVKRACSCTLWSTSRCVQLVGRPSVGGCLEHSRINWHLLVSYEQQQHARAVCSSSVRWFR